MKVDLEGCKCNKSNIYILAKSLVQEKLAFKPYYLYTQMHAHQIIQNFYGRMNSNFMDVPVTI